MPTTIMTQFTPPRKARSVNQTSSSFVAKIPTVTVPADDAATATGQASVEMRNGGAFTQNGLVILPYGTGSNGNTFSMRVVGWRQFGTDPHTLLWLPTTLAEFLCTLDSAILGIAGKTIVATEYFCGTIAIVGTSGNPNVSCEIVSPAVSGSMAHVVVDTKGFEKIELSFSTGSSATDCNALFSQF